jgi:nucleotide-binding universal stress UspA family protein
MAAIPRSILVATDFSTVADHALGFARRLAAVFDAEIHLVHVRVLLDGTHRNEDLQRELERLDAENDRETEETLARHAEADDVVIHPRLARGLAVTETLLETASELGCDLIVAGTHGRRGLRHLLLGSVAEELIRTSPIPVLTVREQADTDESDAGSILVTHDFSPRSEAAVAVAREWALTLGSKVTLLHVVEPVVYPEFYAVDVMPEEILHRVEERSLEAMRKTADERLRDVPHSVDVRTGPAVDVILDEADPSRHDVVIMGTRGLSGLQHLLLGSVAEGVVRRSRIPVLTVREPGE